MNNSNTLSNKAIYSLNKNQRRNLISLIRGHMRLEKYCSNYNPLRIRSIYLSSIETSPSKNIFDGTLRMRKYGNQETVFFEFRKHNKNFSYSRIELSQLEIDSWLINGILPIRGNNNDSILISEINDAIVKYNLKPSTFISKERLDYKSICNENIFLYIDDNIKQTNDDLTWKDKSIPRIIDYDESILTIKYSSTVPSWLLEIVNELNLKIIKTNPIKVNNPSLLFV